MTSRSSLLLSPSLGSSGDDVTELGPRPSRSARASVRFLKRFSQACYIQFERLVERVENLPERSHDRRGVRILHDVATEHQAIDGGTELPDPLQYFVEAAATRAPDSNTGISAYSVTSVSVPSLGGGSSRGLHRPLPPSGWTGEGWMLCELPPGRIHPGRPPP